MSQKITLEEIKHEQTKIQGLIARYESGKKVESVFPLTISKPDLEDGETWVGLIVIADGTKAEHVILLPEESEPATWKNQMEWAKSVGGTLPDKHELSMLLRFLEVESVEKAYWTCETLRDNADWAWYQTVFLGNQYRSNKSAEFRARAVRRVSVI